MPFFEGKDSQGNEYIAHVAPRDFVEEIQDMSYVHGKIQQQAVAQTTANIGWGIGMAIRVIGYWFRVVFNGLLGERIGLALGAVLAYGSLTSGETYTGSSYDVFMVVFGIIVFGTIFAYIGGFINRLFFG